MRTMPARENRKLAQSQANTNAKLQHLWNRSDERLVLLENLGIQDRLNLLENQVSENTQKNAKTYQNLCEACSNIIERYVTLEADKGF